jgi:hypothetical protein
MWDVFYYPAKTDKHKLGVAEFFEFMLHIFCECYEGKAESFVKLGKTNLNKARAFRQNSAMGSSSENVQVWLREVET